jgi:hypothetical protein
MRLNDKHQQAGSHNHNEMYHKINDLHAHVTKGTPGAEDILRDTHKRLTYVDAIHAHESGADHPVLAAHAAHVKAQAAAAAAPAPATPGPPPLPPAPPAPAPIPRVITAADFLQNHHNAAGVAKGDAFRFSTPAEAQAVIDHLVAGHGPAAIAAAASGAYTFGPANEWELKATPGGHVLTKVASLLGVIGPRVTYTLTRVKDAAKRPPLTTPKAPAALKHEVPPAPVVEAPVAPAKVDPVVPHVAVEAPPAQAEAPKAPKGPRKLPKLQAA